MLKNLGNNWTELLHGESGEMKFVRSPKQECKMMMTTTRQQQQTTTTATTTTAITRLVLRSENRIQYLLCRRALLATPVGA